MRKAVVIGSGLLLLALVNVGIWHKERLRETGSEVLLELAPVDPRSLMQGDYMVLRYRIAGQVPAPQLEGTRDGYLILGLDTHRVARLARISERPDPAPGEVALRFRVRQGRIRLAGEAFFFEEGAGRRYGEARYGAFRVGSDGEALLTGLHDKDYRLLGESGQGS